MQRVPMRQQNNQTTKQPDNKTTKQQNNKTTSIVWKTIPSEARVTRDEVSGLQLRRKELSGRQYQHKQNLRAHRYATTTNVQNLSRITLMRRILSFSRISFNLV